VRHRASIPARKGRWIADHRGVTMINGGGSVQGDGQSRMVVEDPIYASVEGRWRQHHVLDARIGEWTATGGGDSVGRPAAGCRLFLPRFWLA